MKPPLLWIGCFPSSIALADLFRLSWRIKALIQPTRCLTFHSGTSDPGASMRPTTSWPIAD